MKSFLFVLSFLAIAARRSALAFSPKAPISLRISSRLEAMPAVTNAMPSLTKESVQKAIDDACHEKGGKPETLKSYHGLTVQRIRDWQAILEETVSKDMDASSDYLKNRTPWHFGISILNAHNNIVGSATFYMAYSSWSGRILYIDRLECKGLNDEMEELLLRILADVALALDCVRLTWRVSFRKNVLTRLIMHTSTQNFPIAAHPYAEMAFQRDKSARNAR
jgi:hypothetical protein